MSPRLDLDFVRAHFPALRTDWALMDNAGGSAPCRQVIERVTEHLSRRPVQLGATYELSVHAQEAVDAGRAAAATMMNADAGEVVLGASSTALARTLARALRPLWREGDRVIVTDLDHETNIGGWRALEGSGIELVEWPFDRETCALRMEDLEPLLTERTRLVAFTHCANVVGQIHDARAICERVHEAGALTCVDGVAFAPHRRVDVKALDTDFYFFSFYKTYGPHLAALYGKREQLLALRNQNHFFVGEDEVPYKLEPGGVNHELVASLPGILEYHEALDARHDGGPGSGGLLERTSALFAKHEMDLARPLLAFLDEHPRVTLYGSAVPDPAKRVPTIAFSVEDTDSSAITAALDEHRLAARYGHFYAYRAIERLGLHERNGIVRVSLVHYNTPGEVLRLVETLDAIL